MGLIRDHGDGPVSIWTYDELPPRARRLIQTHGAFAERALRMHASVEDAIRWMMAKRETAKRVNAERRHAA